ncbi:hypothetical protein PVAND_007252 [Polypedilum vanderplanki]|uniref:Uncharacterized protein n=1 Tax=Polypedilum vanderplanki TaxID=319348 RepID=A0A9J6C686_POLVA|nr:hypothetical protein PVAND_007252 [Polypedilum vanderplanki]
MKNILYKIFAIVMLCFITVNMWSVNAEVDDLEIAASAFAVPYKQNRGGHHHHHHHGGHHHHHHSHHHRGGHKKGGHYG